MPVITVSRQLGSLGTEIARLLSNNIKSNYLDKESLETTFQEYGIPKESVERYDEKKPGFWDIFKTDKARYLHFMKGVIFDHARKGNCVILGRGSQMVLGNLPGVLNVRVVAPFETRINRIMGRLNCEERHAEKLLRHNDNERAGFHKFFFDCRWEDDCLYDLVINTGFFSAETAASLIGDAVKTREFKETKQESQKRLNDLSLAHHVKTGILYEEKISIQFLEVFSRNGVITLGGIVTDIEDVERCGKIAEAIDGVNEVRNDVYHKPLATNYGLHY